MAGGDENPRDALIDTSGISELKVSAFGKIPGHYVSQHGTQMRGRPFCPSGLLGLDLTTDSLDSLADSLVLTCSET